ncbi:hypothetical protein HMPREF1868_00373 [Olsenella sp. DNF00959]|nr:hypothetical protein HMPREF1868_00373 [Olsenella sp. DNF00959]
MNDVLPDLIHADSTPSVFDFFESITEGEKISNSALFTLALR